MLGLLRFGRYSFCKITPHIYQTLFYQFTKTPQIETLGKYFISTNLLQIYNIVKNAKINPMQKITIFGQIQQKICTQYTDLEFNILANIHKDKSNIYLQVGRLAEAVIQIQRAVKAIQGMEQPFNIQVAALLQTAGNLHVRTQNYSKAQKFLKDAEHILNLTQEQILESSEIPSNIKQGQFKQINKMLARIFSQFCLIHMQLGHIYEARQYLAKALQKWKTIEQKNNLAYLLTIKFKCILHLMAKQQKMAINSAKQFLEQYGATQETVAHRMWFMKFLIDKGIDTYSQQLKSNIENLSKVLKQKDLTDLLIKIGVIKKPRQQNTNQPNKDETN